MHDELVCEINPDLSRALIGMRSLENTRCRPGFMLRLIAKLQRRFETDILVVDLPTGGPTVIP
jgi:hypothetical protein